MPRRTKDAPGRVTPTAEARRQAGVNPTIGGRYTAPLPVEYRHSPWWVPAFMLGFFVLGLLMIVLNYISLLPSAPSNWYLLGGLGLIVCGFAVSTQYR
jgi:hypothetical protein